MKLITLSLLVTLSSFAQIQISERVVAEYHVDKIANLHTYVAYEFIKEKLRSFECLEPEVTTTIVKKSKFRFFSNNIPGLFQVDLKTKCFSEGLEQIKFALGGFGYDEDYTTIDLEVILNGKTHLYQTCAYGLDSAPRKCPSFYADFNREFSQSL